MSTNVQNALVIMMQCVSSLIYIYRCFKLDYRMLLELEMLVFAYVSVHTLMFHVLLYHRALMGSI